MLSLRNKNKTKNITQNNSLSLKYTVLCLNLKDYADDNTINLTTTDFIPSGTDIAYSYASTLANGNVPIGPLSAITGTVLLTCQSNRFVDNSINNFIY